MGTYENLKYTNKNNYHYVTITYNASNSVYLWKNRAGRIYKLHPTDKANELRVDENVAYYSAANWKIAKVTDEGIYGPYNELFTRMNWFKLFNIFYDLKI